MCDEICCACTSQLVYKMPVVASIIRHITPHLCRKSQFVALNVYVHQIRHAIKLLWSVNSCNDWRDSVLVLANEAKLSDMSIEIQVFLYSCVSYWPFPTLYWNSFFIFYFGQAQQETTITKDVQDVWYPHTCNLKDSKVYFKHCKQIFITTSVCVLKNKSNLNSHSLKSAQDNMY